MMSTSTFPSIFNTYLKLPNFEMGIDEIERVVMERVKFLHMMSQYAEKSEHKRYSNGYYYRLMTSRLITEAEFPTYFNLLMKDQSSLSDELKFESRKTDHAAHYMTLLAFAMNPSIQQWFLNAEVDFARLKVYVIRNAEFIVEEIGIPYSKPSVAELYDFAKKIEDGQPPSSHFHANNESILKVDFRHALELVRHRSVFLKAGYAYVSTSQLGGVIGQRFRENVEEALKLCASNRDFFMEDDRISRLATIVLGAHRTMLSGIVCKDYNKEYAVSCLATMKPEKFPLCMKRLHYSLQERRHLKYGDRMRLQVFLRGAGLSLTDSLRYWRESFYGNSAVGSTTDSDNFKKYLYSIRYSYGEEGSRVARAPYNCAKIVSSSDGEGCPFKDNGNLHELLRTEGIVPIEDIGEILKEKIPQSKCAKYFKSVNNVEYPTLLIGHPNEYYAQSIMLHAKPGNRADNEPATTIAMVPSEDKSAERIIIFDSDATLSPSKRMKRGDGQDEADFSGLGYL